MLGPGGAGQYPIAMTRVLTADERTKLADSAVAIYVTGRIEYRDAFRRRWRSHFRFLHTARAAYPEANMMAVAEEGNWEERVRLWSRWF